jgi:hypothetical protein
VTRDALLLKRADRAVSEAFRTNRRSRALVWGRRLALTPEWMLTRCAWCKRISLAGLWLVEEEMPAFITGDLEEHTTHGICRRCLSELESAGRTRPLS